jgi:hypothetical protein
MKKSITILLIVVIVLGISAYFYNFYENVFRYNLTSQYQTSATNTQIDTSKEIVGQPAPESFMLIGKMLQIRIDSTSKPWWGQATVMGGAEPNTNMTDVGYELLGTLSQYPDGTKFYARIFKGDCAHQSVSKYRLVPLTVTYGKGAGSQSVFQVPLDQFLADAPMSIQIYSDPEYKTPYACGVINFQ